MDRVRRGRDAGWAMVVIACLFGTASGAEKLGTESSHAAPEPITKLIVLKYRDPENLRNVLGALPVHFSPDVQTNRLLVIALPEQMKQVEELVRELDVPIERTAVQPELELRVYRLRHRQPRELLDCLVPMLSDRGKISADPGSRTLIVKDEPAIHTDLVMLLRELDVVLGDASGATATASAPDMPLKRLTDEVTINTTPQILPVASNAGSNPQQPTVQLRLRVCELNREALPKLTEELGPAGEASLLAAILEGSPLNSAHSQSDVEECLAKMLEHGAIKMLSEPTLHVVSGYAASFLSSMGGLDAPVVVEDDPATEATTRFNGWGMDLRFVPTVVSPDHIVLQMSPPFSPPHREANKPMAFEADGQPELLSVELRRGQVHATSGKVRTAKQIEPSQGGLGAVPVLGQLFRSKRQALQESEMILLVHPEIVDQRADQIARQPGTNPTQSRQ